MVVNDVKLSGEIKDENPFFKKKKNIFENCLGQKRTEIIFSIFDGATRTYSCMALS